MSKEKGAKYKFIILIIIFTLLIIISAYIQYTHYQDRSLKETAKSPIIFILFYIAISFFPIPFAPTSFAGGLFYTFGQSFLYTLIANTIFTTLIFFMTRYLGRNYIFYIIEKHKKYFKLEKSFEKRAFTNIIMMRIFFLIPGEVISIFCAISKVKFKTYFLASFIGTIPLIFFTSMLVRSTIKSDIFYILIALLALFLMLIIPLIFLKEIKKLT